MHVCITFHFRMSKCEHSALILENMHYFFIHFKSTNENETI